MARLESFNPTIDRYDQRSAARLFQLLWPEAVAARAISWNLAASVRVAHAAADACWGVTMHSDMVRLNVGQVETLTLSAKGARFFFKSPLDAPAAPGFEIEHTESPVFPSVPVPSGVCFVAHGDMASLPASVRTAHEGYVRAAASLKKSSPFKRSFSPAVLEHVEEVLGTTLPRPSYASTESSGQRVDPLPDEVDTAHSCIEGACYRVTVNAYDRDPRARRLCIAKHGTACAICGFSFGAVYGAVADGYVHVHHLRPLSEAGNEYEVNPTEDLRPVCPNCHAVLHRRVPAFSIDDVRTFLSQNRRS